MDPIDPKRETSEQPDQTAQPSANAVGEDVIAKRAYQLWVQRGCPEGSPEEDWYRAEKELGIFGNAAGRVAYAATAREPTLKGRMSIG